MNNTIEQTLSLIESWLDKKGFVLCKSKKPTIEDEVDFERKVVFLSLRSSPINQLYSLLHECGHIILRNRKDYKEKYKASYEVNEENGRASLRSSVEEVEEEINAWREGENLCKKLSISIEKDQYYRYASRWVMSYIVLAAIGNEHLLRTAKDKDDTKLKMAELCKLLDNAHDVCYNEVISGAENL
jgi:hypothetical protein